MSEADDKVGRMVAQMYREKKLFESNPFDHQLHLAVCPTMRAEDSSAINGEYGCDTGCPYYDLEATIKCDCPTIADDDFTYGSFGDTSSLLEALIEMDNGQRDNLDQWPDKVFGADATNPELRKNRRRIEALKATGWVS